MQSVIKFSNQFKTLIGLNEEIEPTIGDLFNQESNQLNIEKTKPRVWLNPKTRVKDLPERFKKVAKSNYFRE